MGFSERGRGEGAAQAGARCAGSGLSDSARKAVSPQACSTRVMSWGCSVCCCKPRPPAPPLSPTPQIPGSQPRIQRFLCQGHHLLRGAAAPGLTDPCARSRQPHCRSRSQCHGPGSREGREPPPPVPQSRSYRVAVPAGRRESASNSTSEAFQYRSLVV